MISKIKGTHDFLDLKLYNFIIETIREHLKFYHFQEIKTPILEPTELFQRSLGLQTDVVTKEMFIVSSTGKSDDAICLRPEATASTMRAFLEHHIDYKPWKVFSFGPMFRHERPQKGRMREFHQANIEIIGTDTSAEDVFLITMLDRLFQEKFTLDNYALIINYLGNAEDREKFKETLSNYLDSIFDSLCETCKVRKEKNILRVFDCKNLQCKTLYKNAPKIADNLSEESESEWKKIQEQLQLLSISFTHDPTLVRGLDYYDNIVFEFVSSNLGAQNSFCSGGRYNRLAKELGAKEEVPSIGAALGIERLSLLLEPMLDVLRLPQEKSLHLIIPMDKEQEMLSLLLADDLLAHGLTTDILFEGSLKSKMRRANKVGAAFVMILGSDEQAAGEVTVKNMMTGDEQKIRQTELVEFLKK